MTAELALPAPLVADKERTPTAYIPFARARPLVPGVSSRPLSSLWIAESTDGRATWTPWPSSAEAQVLPKP